MPSTELGLVCQSRTLRWLLAAGAGLGALSWLLEAVGWFALSATNTVTTLDLARASAWLWCAAAAVVLAGFAVASWEAFVATGHGELVAWRSGAVLATFVVALGALISAASFSSPGAGSSATEAAGYALWAVLLGAGMARRVALDGSSSVGAQRTVPPAATGLIIGAGAFVALVIASVLPGLSIGDVTPATLGDVFWAVGFVLGALAMVRGGLVGEAHPATPYLLGALLVGAAGEIAHAAATPLVWRFTSTPTDFRVGPGAPALVLTAALGLGALAGLVAADRALGLPAAPRRLGSTAPSSSSESAPVSAPYCAACGQPTTPGARFCSSCGKALG